MTPSPDYLAGWREALEAAARCALDWQGRVAMGTTHANAAHDETLARVAAAIRTLKETPK